MGVQGLVWLLDVHVERPSGVSQRLGTSVSLWLEDSTTPSRLVMILVISRTYRNRGRCLEAYPAISCNVSAEASPVDQTAQSEPLDETWASVVAIDVKMLAQPPEVRANEQVTSLGQVEPSSPTRRAKSSKGRFKRKRRQRIQKPGSEKPSHPSEAASAS